ncbi:hypothetical protein GV790_30440, partial [Nocardia cyriacigeorgica]|nr:hypothetical protein [Nocardia cyriacigeorgica]
RVRDWLSQRRRFEFCLTTVMVMLLTGTCAALLLLPDSVVARTRAANSAGVADTTTTGDRDQSWPHRSVTAVLAAVS